MAKQRTSESNDFDFDEDEFEDYEDADDEELDEDDVDNEEFDVDSLTPSERKRYEKMREEVENSVVEAIAKGDTDSGVYKGLQRVLASRDRQLAETRNALAGVMQRVGTVEESSGDMEFLRNIISEMLDNDDRKLFEDKFMQHKSSRENKRNAELLQGILSGQGQQVPFNPQVPAYGAMEDDPQIRQYRQQASVKLKAYAKKLTGNPDAKGLDYGDEDEPLLVRMDKLMASVERLQNEEDDADTDRVRRRVNPTNTRTRNGVVGKGQSSGSDLLAKGSSKMVDLMRKAK